MERPNVLVCAFEPQFLEVPQECLILTMKANQKYFPLLDAVGKLTNKFLVVSNISPADTSFVTGGNERVVPIHAAPRANRLKRRISQPPNRECRPIAMRFGSRLIAGKGKLEVLVMMSRRTREGSRNAQPKPTIPPQSCTASVTWPVMPRWASSASRSSIRDCSV